jgi:hypothetical protein
MSGRLGILKRNINATCSHSFTVNKTIAVNPYFIPKRIGNLQIFETLFLRMNIIYEGNEAACYG